MNLTVDIGNTRVKIALFDQSNMVLHKCVEDPSREIDNIPQIDKAIVVSTKDSFEEIVSMLEKKCRKIILLDHNTPIPIKNLYQTPEKLGYDRLASAIGAWSLKERRNLAIFDFGSALTIDVVTENGEYLGGNISPGVNMRFKALNKFTDKLPLLSLENEVNITGNNTKSAIISGVANSILFEVKGYIDALEQKYGEIDIFFCGGDANFFVKQLKNTIFVVPNLVHVGLNEILEYND